MKSGLFPGNYCHGVLLSFLLACLAGQAAGSGEDESGWVPQPFQAPEPWRELDSELPAYPQDKNLLETGDGTSRRPFRFYLDVPSVSVTDDQVVRYTVVIISDDGIRNVTHEGLRCGEKAYRRYAYGINGEWHKLSDSPWLPLSGDGMNAYRSFYYENYMCDPASPYLQPEQIIRKFRLRRMTEE